MRNPVTVFSFCMSMENSTLYGEDLLVIRTHVARDDGITVVAFVVRKRTMNVIIAIQLQISP